MQVHSAPDAALEKATMRRITLRLVPFLMLCYFFALLDRVNVGFAALQMNKDLGLSPAVFGPIRCGLSASHCCRLRSSLLAATMLVFRRLGHQRALTLGLLVSQRNMGLMVAATAGALPELTWLYFAMSQFPIYLAPQLLKPLVGRMGAGDQNCRHPRTGG